MNLIPEPPALTDPSSGRPLRALGLSMQTFRANQYGKYWLTDRIAVGGMAELFRGKIIGDKGFEKLVALKKILPHLADQTEAIDYFIDEARLAALLQHPNIIQIYDFGRLEETYFIAMEYLFGKDLKTVLHCGEERGRPLSLEEGLHITAKICAGLDYAHTMRDLQGQSLQIIHRDISPPNIFITYDGQVKIIDFGIAKAASRITNTRTGIIKGKVAYMSPEQADGQPIDHRSDIFSVGILLYEMATRRHMYDGDAMAILAQAREARFTRADRLARDLPECVGMVLDQALARDPDDRYTNCGDMLADIDDCLFLLGLRPSDQKLAACMRSLFEPEIYREKALMTWELNRGSSSGEGMPPAGGPVLPQGELEATVALSAEPGSHRRRPGRWWMLAALVGLLAAGVLTAYLAGRSAPDGGPAVVVRIPIDSPPFPATGAPEPPAGTRHAQLRDFLVRAELSLEAWRLSEPPGDNALYYYRQALQVDPGNSEAQQGFSRIAQRYAHLAEKELARDNTDKALQFVQLGLSIDAGHQKLGKLRDELNRRAGLESQRQIQRYLVMANERLTQLKLTQPPEDNALHFFQLVRGLDPENAEARRGIEKIASRYAELAENEMKRFRYEQARRYVRTGLAVDPLNARLLVLQEEVNQRFDQRVWHSLRQIFK
jgi:serine/threonine protein kinase